MTIKEILHNTSYNVKMKKFYFNNKENTHSLLSILINYSIILVITFSFVYIFSAYKTKSSITRFFLASMLTIAVAALLYLTGKKKMENLKKIKHKEIALDYIQNNIANLDEKSFSRKIIQLLLNMPNFKDVKIHGTIITANYKGHYIAIGFDKIPMAQYTYADKINTFIENMLKFKLNVGLFFTSSYFNEECYTIIDKSSNMHIKFVDIDELSSLIEKYQLGPSEELIVQIVNQKVSESTRNISKVKKQIIAPKKVHACFNYAILFSVCALLFKTMALYYIVISVFFLTLAILIYLLSHNTKQSETFFPDNIFSENKKAGS